MHDEIPLLEVILAAEIAIVTTQILNKVDLLKCLKILLQLSL